jgi:outer membrane protein assembly factor BamD (BamD/ComL family)
LWRHFWLAGVMILSACGSKDKVKNDAKGRPDELYTDAMTKLRKGHYDEARLPLNVVIPTRIANTAACQAGDG